MHDSCRKISVPSKQFLHSSLKALASRPTCLAQPGPCSLQMDMVGFSLCSCEATENRVPGKTLGEGRRFVGGRRAPAKLSTPPTHQFQRFHQYREFLCGKALSNCFKNKNIPDRVNTPRYWSLPCCEQVCKLLQTDHW